MEKSELDKLLELASMEDLKSFVGNYAKTHQQFGEDITRFLVKKYLNKKKGASDSLSRLEYAFMDTMNVGDRWHRYDVTDWKNVVKVGSEVLKDARRLLEMGNAQAALQIATRMFELGREEDLNYVDEMEEYAISELFEDYGKLMVDALADKNILQSDKDRTISLLRMTVKSNLHQYDYIDINKLLREALAASQSNETILNMIDEMMRETTRESELEEYVRKKAELLVKMNRLQDADETIKKYLYLPGIRKDEIQRLIDAGELKAALSLAEDGSKSDSGRRTVWLEIEYDIYDKMGDRQNQQNVCRELFISERGSMKNYNRLKKLVPKGEWSDFLQELLTQTNMNVWLYESLEADIYVAEHDGERLYRLLMREDHHTLGLYDNYAQKVNKEHAPEILTEYVTMLKDYASRNMGAKHYIRIRQSMNAMQKITGGKESAHQLAEFFRETYSRRPSFMAEISKF